MVDVAHGAGGAWLSLGLQGFFVLCVWRLARRLYPLIDAIKDMAAGDTAGGDTAMAQTGAGDTVFGDMALEGTAIRYGTEAVDADHGDDPIAIQSIAA